MSTQLLNAKNNPAWVGEQLSKVSSRPSKPGRENNSTERPYSIEYLRSQRGLVRAVHDLVERSWKKLPEPDRVILRDLAYACVDGPKGLARWAERLQYEWLKLQMRNWSKEQKKLFQVYVKDVISLVDSILAATERENEDYQAQLKSSIEQAITSSKSAKSLSAKEAGEYLKQLSSRIHR